MALQWEQVQEIIRKDDRGKSDLLVKPWDIKWSITDD